MLIGTGHLGTGANDVAATARSAFVDAMSTSLWVAVGFTLVATVVALVYLPRPIGSIDSAPTEQLGHTAHSHPVDAGASSASSDTIGAA